MKLNFAILKSEKQEDGSLRVFGTATSEALDSQGEVLDYDGSKAAFGAWRGNLREQHDRKKAVGRALNITYRDDDRAIDVEAFVSKGAPDTQAKVLDGTLAAFSIGGEPKSVKAEKRGGKTVNVIKTWDMNELSIVDVGANPDTNNLVSLAKGDAASDVLVEDELEPVVIVEENRFKAAMRKAGLPIDTPAAVAAIETPVIEGEFAPSRVATAKASFAAWMSKQYSWRSEMDDLSTAVYICQYADSVESMTRGLMAAEMAESEDGAEETGQIKTLRAALALFEQGHQAIKNFIGDEASELVSMEASKSVTPGMRALFTEIHAIRAGQIELSKAQPSVGLRLEDGDALAVSIGELVTKGNEATSKAMGDLRTEVLGQVEALSTEVISWSKSPRGGGPKTRVSTDAVNSGTVTAAIDPNSEVAVIKRLIARTSDHGVRGALARELAMATERAK